jgi:hypothetical protein
MLHEWDSWIHARCAIDYLHGALHPRTLLQGSKTSDPPQLHPQDEEAQIIIHNGYTVVLDFSLEEAQ